MSKPIKKKTSLNTLQRWSQAAREKRDRAMDLASDRIGERGFVDGLTLGPARRALRLGKTAVGTVLGVGAGSAVSDAVHTTSNIAQHVAKWSGNPDAARYIARNTKDFAEASRNTCEAFGAMGGYLAGSLATLSFVESAVEQGSDVVSRVVSEWND